MKEDTPVRNTINYLKGLREMRAVGNRPAQMPSDPTWLVNQAINRRAGWLEDDHFRGTTQGIQGSLHVQPHLPRKARGDYLRHLEQLARRINNPRLIVHASELGSLRGLLEARLPDRFTY